MIFSLDIQRRRLKDKDIHVTSVIESPDITQAVVQALRDHSLEDKEALTIHVERTDKGGEKR